MSADFLSLLTKVDDVDTEVFELFSNVATNGSNLGMLAASEDCLEITIGGHDYTISQSPGLLRSDNSQGTTGAAAWQSGLRFSRWLARDDNTLFAGKTIPENTVVIELGAGVAGLVSCLLARRCGAAGKVITSDMAYAQKLLRQNIANNTSHRGNRKPKQSIAPIEVVTLDWEQDDAVSLLKSLGHHGDIDLLVACDCIYNYALVKPFLDTCKAICKMREPTNATLAFVVQQLRQPDVFEEWLDQALGDFDVWRVPPTIAGAELSEAEGFIMHVLVVK